MVVMRDVRRWRRLAAIGVVVALGVSPASAQGVVPLSIDEAVRRAMDTSPRLEDVRARERAAAATTAARQALGQPALVAMANVLRTNHVEPFGIPQADGRLRIIFPDIPTNYRARVEFTVPLYTSGRVAALVASARAEARAVSAESAAIEAELTLEVTAAYWTLVTARERAAVHVRALERADALLADARARVDAGLLSPHEALLAQAQRARQNVQLIQARNEAAAAETQVARLAGLTPGTAVATTSSVMARGPRVEALAALPATALVALAATARPERRVFTEREASLRRAGEAAGAAARPQVGAVAAVEPARPNQRFVPRSDVWHTGWDLGVTATWSLWDSGRSRAEQAVTVAQAEAVRARLADFDAGLEVEVRQRLLDGASARAAFEASAEVVAAASEAARVLRERFAAGVATSSEVLDAEVGLVEAELERTRLAAAWRLADARLIRVLGGAE